MKFIKNLFNKIFKTKIKIIFSNGENFAELSQFNFYSEISYCDCQKGWKILLWNLSLDISKALNKCSKEFKENFKVIQVKEKYGGLRFYTTYGNEEIFALIDKAEEKSFKICEKCGNPGELRGKIWYMTRCDKCWSSAN